MSENTDLLQGIQLASYVRKICPKCKTSNDPHETSCTHCKASLPAPVVTRDFFQDIEAALRRALGGGLAIDDRGGVSDILKAVPKLGPYLTRGASIYGLEGAINFGFPRLVAECDTVRGLYPDVSPSLRTVREFLAGQLKIAKNALTDLRGRNPENPVESLVKDYDAGLKDLIAKQEKVKKAVGKTQVTTPTVKAASDKLAGILQKLDDVGKLVGPNGPLWGLYASKGQNESKPEWVSLLRAVTELANYPNKVGR